MTIGNIQIVNMGVGAVQDGGFIIGVAFNHDGGEDDKYTYKSLVVSLLLGWSALGIMITYRKLLPSS